MLQLLHFFVQQAALARKQPKGPFGFRVMQPRNGTGQDFLDPTGKFQNHRRLTGRSTGFRPARSTGVFTEGFSSLFKVFNEKFSKGGHG